MLISYSLLSFCILIFTDTSPYHDLMIFFFYSWKFAKFHDIQSMPGFHDAATFSHNTEIIGPNKSKKKSLYFWHSTLIFSRSLCSIKPRKGNPPHKRWMVAVNHGKCRPCPIVHSSLVCGSDGHTYSSKVRYSSLFTLSWMSWSHDLSIRTYFSLV